MPDVNVEVAVPTVAAAIEVVIPATVNIEILTGPSGPAGPAGATGPAGPPGTGTIADFVDGGRR